MAVSSLTSLCLNFLVCKNGGNIVPASWDCSIYFMGSNELPSVKRLEPYLSHGKHSGDKTTTHRKKISIWNIWPALNLHVLSIKSWLALMYPVDRVLFKLTVFCFVDFVVQKTNCGVHINLNSFWSALIPIFHYLIKNNYILMLLLNCLFQFFGWCEVLSWYRSLSKTTLEKRINHQSSLLSYIWSSSPFELEHY